MRCLPALALGLLTAAVAHGQDPKHETNATIIKDGTQVKSGIGTVGPGAYYATGYLNNGDRVKVELAAENGCYPISPPAGSYDLISKHDISTPDHRGLAKVKKDNALVLMGSKFKGPQDNPTRAVRNGLNRGAEVFVVGTLEGEYFPIKPESSLRFVPVEAVQLDAGVQEKLEQPPVSAGTPGQSLDPSGGDQSIDPTTQQNVAQAEQTYRKAQANNQAADWAAAQQLYEGLAKSTNPDVRLTALNRLEFIRLRNRPPAYANSTDYQTGRYNGTASPTGFRPTGSAPRAASNYAYAPDAGPARLVPLTPPPATAPAAPPAMQPPAVAPPASQPPVAQLPAAPVRTAPPAGNVAAKEFGQLLRSNRMEGGRPVFFLRDSLGNLKCYVVPSDGVPLESYVGQNVEVTSRGPMTYHTDLRAYMLTASQVTPMNR